MQIGEKNNMSKRMMEEDKTFKSTNQVKQANTLAYTSETRTIDNLIVV